ncbi:metallophosphoesterase family protein [Paenibacillus soyae]|uniref:Serine/threonine protein phosphatase n=1 Tax=Paenibacillus soyae TaxID=2969249 RepID=A0A9X2SAF8_9BACL|nr:metallophosphoesterase family protein [Paenibacillus soyae]MCR2806629.1 serine/threonine protein phosphatase [Paenibacillus soyae]
MKYFITDIHGDGIGLEKLLAHASMNWSTDQLVFGGDYIDRGHHSGKVLKKVMSLMEAHPESVFAVVGNHEEMMLDYFRHGDPLWMKHGGKEALPELKAEFGKSFDEMLRWVDELPIIHQDDEFVYTHSGLEVDTPLANQTREILWMDESAFYGLSREGILALTQGKPVVHGHTPVERIYFDGARLNGDLGSNTYWIEEERALGLVNLTAMDYVAYRQANGSLTTRKIMKF